MSYSSFFYVIEQAPKRHKGNGDQTTEEYMETETGLVGKNGPPGYNLAQSDTKKPQRGPVVGAMRQNDDKQELRNDKSSVFISNLAYTLEEPEAKLRTLFEMCGSIEQVRPIFGNKGAFKGYCYIQFESASSVTEALKLDRRELEGRPMFVSPCVDKNKNPDFKVNKVCFCQVLSTYRKLFFFYFVLAGVQIQHINGETQNLHHWSAVLLH